MSLYGASDALDAWRPVHSCDDALAPALPPDARVPSEDPSSACWMDDIIALANADAAAKRRAASTAAFLEHDEVTSPRTLAAPKTKPRAHPAAPAEAKPPRPVGVAAACRKFVGGAAAKKWANKLDGGDAESHPGSPRSASPAALAPKHHPRPKQQRNSSPLATPAKAEEPEPEPEPEPDADAEALAEDPSLSHRRRPRPRRAASASPSDDTDTTTTTTTTNTGTDEDSAKPCIETLARLGGDITSVCAALDAIDGFAAAGAGTPAAASPRDAARLSPARSADSRASADSDVPVAAPNQRRTSDQRGPEDPPRSPSRKRAASRRALAFEEEEAADAAHRRPRVGVSSGIVPASAKRAKLSAKPRLATLSVKGHFVAGGESAAPYPAGTAPPAPRRESPAPEPFHVAPPPALDLPDVHARKGGFELATREGVAPEFPYSPAAMDLGEAGGMMGARAFRSMIGGPLEALEHAFAHAFDGENLAC